MVFEPLLQSQDEVETPRHCPLLGLLAAAAAGIVLDRYAPQPFGLWWLAAVAAWLAWWAGFRGKRLRLAIVPLLVAWLCTLAAWHHARWYLYPQSELGRCATLDTVPACLEATALGHPRWRPGPGRDPLSTIPAGDRCQVLVRMHAARHGDRWLPVSGQATLSVEGHLPGVRAGDRLRLLVLMQRIPRAQNPGEYDAALHERVERHLVRLSAPSPDCITVLEKGWPCSPRRMLGDVRQACQEQLWQRIAPERAGLAAGLLTGAREQIGTERRQEFFLTGTIHILAISGVHVAILTLGFWSVMRTGLVSRRLALVGAIGFVVLYALLTTGQPPVIRAAVLVVVVCCGRWLGERSSPLNALAAAGLLVLAMNPAELLEVGTQLSFLAVAALIFARPVLTPRSPRDKLERFLLAHEPLPRKAVRWCGSLAWRLWLTGAVIWLAALPLTMHHFHVASPAALWVNPLIWLPVMLVLYCGFLSLVLAWLVPPLGELFASWCDWLLGLTQALIGLAQQSPLAYHWLAGPTWWWVVGWYAALAAWLLLPRWRPRWYWAAALVLAWIAIGQLASPRSFIWRWTAEPELACTFVAVGHGTSALIELPDGRTLLYDAGHMGSSRGGAQSIAAVLWSRGITHLDAVVLSHADADHYNALPELLERFSVGVIYVSPMMFHFEPPGVAALKEAIERHGVPMKTISAGDTLAVGELVTCEVLHPVARNFYRTDNAASIVLAITFAGRRLLLPGDLETPGLEDVLSEEPLPCEVVMAPHHGSARSNPRGFAEWSSPQWVLISGSRARDASEVIDAYRSYGAEVLHTAHDGATRFRFSANGTQVETWFEDRWVLRRHHAAR